MATLKGATRKADGLQEAVMEALRRKDQKVEMEVVDREQLGILIDKGNGLCKSDGNLSIRSDTSIGAGSKRSLHSSRLTLSDSKEFYRNTGIKWLKAIRCGQVTKVKEMLEEKPELVHYIPLHGPNAIHIATARADRSIILLLLSKGADVDVRNTAGYTSLHMAVLSGDTSMAHFLIAHGANIDLLDPDSQTIESYENWSVNDQKSAEGSASIGKRPKFYSHDLDSRHSPSIKQTMSFNRRPVSSSPDMPPTELKREGLRGSLKSFFDKNSSAKKSVFSQLVSEDSLQPHQDEQQRMTNKRWKSKPKKSSTVEPTDRTDEELDQQRILEELEDEAKGIVSEIEHSKRMQSGGFDIRVKYFVAKVRVYRLMQENREDIRASILLGNLEAISEVLTFEQASEQVKKKRARRKARKARGQAGTSNEQHESSDEDSDEFYRREMNLGPPKKDKHQPKDDEGAGPSGTQNRRYDEGSEAEDDSEETMIKSNCTEITYLDDDSSSSSPAKSKPTDSEKAVEESDVKKGYVNEVVPLNAPEDEAPLRTQPSGISANTFQSAPTSAREPTAQPEVSPDAAGDVQDAPDAEPTGPSTNEQTDTTHD